MRRWDLTALPPSTEKKRPRAPRPDAPRVPAREGSIPRVLFSSPECRAVVLEFRRGETMGDHRVRERAVVEIVSGRVSIEASGEKAECGAGTLVTFEPGELHNVEALDDTVLLLVLAPWPAPRHYHEAEGAEPQQLPPNASVDPIDAKAHDE